LAAAEFAEALADVGVEIVDVIPDAIAAYELLVQRATASEAVAVVSGSLYLVGEILGNLREDDEDE
jgi:folylpolyglutamate synthase/dihydropteroate synthase